MNKRSEANVSNDAAITVSKNGGKSFRNNVGGAWTGRKVNRLPNGSPVPSGYTLLKDARWITFGLMNGSADRVGWKTIVITADMVGKKIAQFLSLEMKTATGRARKEQITWHENVWRDGGLTGFCRNDEDVIRVMNGEKIDP